MGKFRIREMRERAMLTQAEVASSLDVSEGRYGNWEREDREINLRDAIRLADLFRCTLDELAGREWPPGSTGSAPPEPGEERVARAWRSMNDRGREKLEDYASDLAANPANTSPKSNRLDSEGDLIA